MDLYTQFQEKYPDFKLSMSKFSKLRPRQCILAGKGGTHNVCVCSIHQNLKLKIYGIKKALKQKGVVYNERDKDLLETMVCIKPTSSCYLLECKKCPKSKIVLDKLKAMFEKNDITKIEFSQWLHTDR